MNFSFISVNVKRMLIFCMQKLEDVQEFLRVPRRNLESRQVKIHKGTLSEQVTNWDDIHNALKGTQYESYLQADYQM